MFTSWKSGVVQVLENRGSRGLQKVLRVSLGFETLNTTAEDTPVPSLPTKSLPQEKGVHKVH